MEELSPLNICHAVAPVRERCPPAPINTEADGRVGPEVVTGGEVALLLICYNTRESCRCTMPGQHSRAGLEDVGMGDATLMT